MEIYGYYMQYSLIMLSSVVLYSDGDKDVYCVCTHDLCVLRMYA